MSETPVQVNEKQVFVRNLPFDVTNEDLSALFEEVGPLKNASVAVSNGVGKGFGFVKFALESDAHAAIEKLQGHVFKGRKLMLELGVKKERKVKGKLTEGVSETVTEVLQPTTTTTTHLKSDKIVKTSAREVAAAAAAADAAHVKRSRQVLVFGVSVDVNKKQFRAIATKGFRKTDVDLLKEDHELSDELHIITPPGKIMLLTANTHKDAALHVKALNGATMHSLIVAYQTQFEQYQKQQEFLKKKPIVKGDKVIQLDNKTNQLEGLDLTKPHKEKLFARTAAQVTPSEQRKRKCRLIVRNLSFLATEQNLLDRMSKFGPVVSVELPKKLVVEKSSDDSKKPGHKRRAEKEVKEPSERSMGFGFVTFLCESDAQAAVSGSSGLKVCNREVAVDFCMSKETYEKYGKKAAEEPGSVVDGEEVAAAEQQVDDEEIGEAKQSEADSDVDVSDDDSESDADTGGEVSSKESDDEDDDQNDNEGELNEDSVIAEEAKPKKEPTDDVHEGCTVFVRGLAFDADSSDIKRSLGKFGRIALAIVVKDKITDMSKGTAFVKFHQADWAAKCVAEAALQGGITIKDRLCKIDLAVDRQSAQSIKDSDLAKRGKDKRNLYLANEGLILPGVEDSAGGDSSVARAQSMSEADKEKRQRAQTEKRKKLQNPLFFVSPTRLSIRNLSKTVNDKELREICITAAKNGIKKGLVKRSDMEAYRLAQGSDAITQQLQKQGIFKIGMDLDAVPPAVGKHCLKNSKVMLDMQRIRGGAPQSRGYAFAEFTHHAHALACLRELNNNAQYSSHHSAGGAPGAGEGVGGKLIVELSLENIQKVKILKDREARQQQRKEMAKPTGESDSSGRSSKRQQKSDQKGSTTVVKTSTNDSNQVEDVKKVVPNKKPVKSYAVNPDTLPAALPEGVNPKHFNKQQERERQKRKRGSKADSSESADSTPAALASSTDYSHEKEDQPQQKKTKTSSSTAVVVPVEKAIVQPKKRKQQQEEQTVTANTALTASPVLSGNAKPSSEQHAAKKAKHQSSATVPASALSGKSMQQSSKGDKITIKHEKNDKKRPLSNKSQKADGSSSATSASAPATPSKGVWGGHKRMRAAKKAQGKK